MFITGLLQVNPVVKCKQIVLPVVVLTSFNKFLKFINYLCSSYPTRASYSGQVDEFRNPMKKELKTWPCWKPVFEIISNTDANFVNLHIDKATKTRSDKQLRFNHTFYETNFKVAQSDF